MYTCALCTVSFLTLFVRLMHIKNGDAVPPGPFRVIMMNDTGYSNVTKLYSSCNHQIWRPPCKLVQTHNYNEVEHINLVPTDIPNTDVRIITSVISPCKTVNTAP